MKRKILFSPLLIIVFIILFGVGIAGAAVFIGGGGNTENVNLQKGLVGWWKFDGNAKDATPYENNGTVTGATLTTDRKGQVNKAYEFDGTANQYIEVADSASLDITDAITLSLWVYDPPPEPPPKDLPEGTKYYYLANWEWFTGDRGSYWRCPGGDCVGLIDLRSLPQMGKAGGAPEGYGFFVYTRELNDPSAIFLGNDLTGSLANKGKLISALKVGGLSSNTPQDALWELLTEKADPTGQTKWKPLRGTPDKGVKLIIADKVIQKPFDQKAKDNTIAVFQADYRRNKAQGVPLETLQRWTGSNMRDLGVGADDLLPPEHKKDGWKEPHTTITESFNTADSDTLGPDLSWTEISGDWDVVSNEVTELSGTTEHQARADSDLSTDDMYSQIVVTNIGSGSNGTWVGPGVRMPSTATRTAYYGFPFQADDNYYHRKIVNGGYTTFASAATDVTVPATWKETADGSTITLYRNGVQVHQQTDTAITGYTRAGLMAYTDSGLIRGDNFEAGDMFETYNTLAGKGVDAYQLMIDDDLNVHGYINTTNEVTAQITKAWRHVVMTYDGATQKLYVDGVLQDSNSFAASIGTNATNLTIGKNVPGKIDDVRVYNRALSQTEVTALYESYDAGIVVSNLQKGLVGQWKFDGNAKDSTPNSNNGTVTGATLTTDRKGQVNKAYEFDGTANQYIEVADSASLDITDAITLSLWVYDPPPEPPPKDLPEGTKYYYLANWEWFTGDGGSYWRCPGGDCVGLIDLRSLPQMGKAGGAPEGYGFFVYTRELNDPSAIFLGNDIDGPLANKGKLISALKVGGLSSNTPQDALWELLTEKADPTGQNKWKPLRGTPDKGVKLVIADKVIEKPFDQKAKNNTIAVFQADYRRNKGNVPEEALQKWVGSTMNNLYGEMSDEKAREIVPNPHKDEKPLWKKPETTIGDTFVEASDTALNLHTATGPNGGFGWTHVKRAWTVQGATDDVKANTTSGRDSARAEINLSSDDHYAQVTMVTIADGGVAVRFASDVETLYHFVARGTHIRIWKIVNGSASALQGDVVHTTSDGDVLYGEADASSLVQKINGVNVNSVTDSTITGFLQTGLVAFNRPVYDNFEAGDLYVGDFYKVLIGKETDAYELRMDDSLNIKGFINNTNTVTSQLTKAWRHAVMTYDGATQKLYVDGVLKDSNSFAASIGTNNNSLKIGNRVPGKIDDVRIYNRALSATEVTALYNSYDAGIQVAATQKGLVGQWKFDGNAKDATPYGHDGSVVDILDLQVGADADDAFDKDGVQNANSDNVFWNWNDANALYGGSRFQNVTIPQGASIVTAYLSLYPVTNGLDDPEFYIRADDADDSGVIEGGTQLSARTLTTAQVLWSATNISLVAYTDSPEIKTVVQEVINRGSWVSGNSLTIIGDDQQNSKKFTSRDKGSYADSAKLHIEYVSQDTPSWVTGRYSTATALDFDGTKYISAGNVSSNARTISFWIKRGDSSDRDVIDLGTPEITITSDAITSTGLTSPTYYVDGIQGNTSLTSGAWHHVVIADTADIAANSVDIGKASSSVFLGLIDDVRIYNRALSQTEIAALYQSY